MVRHYGNCAICPNSFKGNKGLKASFPISKQVVERFLLHPHPQFVDLPEGKRMCGECSGKLAYHYKKYLKLQTLETSDMEQDEQGSSYSKSDNHQPQSSPATPMVESELFDIQVEGPNYGRSTGLPDLDETLKAYGDDGAISGDENGTERSSPITVDMDQDASAEQLHEATSASPEQPIPPQVNLNQPLENDVSIFAFPVGDKIFHVKFELHNITDPGSADSDDEEVTEEERVGSWEVASIRQRWYNKKTFFYYVKWVGDWGSRQHTWEPRRNLEKTAKRLLKAADMVFDARDLKMQQLVKHLPGKLRGPVR